MSRSRAARLTVKQLAEIAGVTPRAVRYYHAVGLLPEPARDGSGYRRYGGQDVVALVRIARLRAVGMPLAQIADRVSCSDRDGAGLAEALTALADEIDAEIGQLAATRDRLRELAGSQAFSEPIEALTGVLRARGVLSATDSLRAGEGWAAAVLDALYPSGMTGILASAAPLLADPAVTEALRPLRRRLGRLGPDSTEQDIANLAADVAGVLPTASLDGRIDVDLIDSVLADQLNPTQQRFVHQLRARLHSDAAAPEGPSQPSPAPPTLGSDHAR